MLGQRIDDWLGIKLEISKKHEVCGVRESCTGLYGYHYPTFVTVVQITDVTKVVPMTL